MTSPLKIGNGAGFWGDDVLASYRLLTQVEDLSYLTLDYLAEVSMSIMAVQQAKNPSLGYAEDFLKVLDALLPLFAKGRKCKIITNAGGLNPRGLAEKCREKIKEAKLSLKVGLIEGEDVGALLKLDPGRREFCHLDTGRSLHEVLPQLTTAHAYIGATPIVQALEGGADIVIGGRIADPSLTVGPARFHFQWDASEYGKIASATLGGHLIECGTQVTGGISTDWLSCPFIEKIGYPVLEIDAQGGLIITKPLGAGGQVTERTVKEQLLYELGDPENYLSPDVSLNVLGVEVALKGENRVGVVGAKGSPPPPTYKVSSTYRAGYASDSYLTLYGDKIKEKAYRAGQAIFDKLRIEGFVFDQTLIEALGTGELDPIIHENTSNECCLHLACRGLSYEAVERFTQLIAPLVTAGPQGTTGYLSGRPKIRPVFGFWPCLISKEEVKLTVEVL